ncbi:programmed cell death protein 5 isoform X2 [Zerene cesonia]|uniref:programmed cell death protein 5 isoform X2 n=1 Tax=Zerene cesonia TaxID=33412 RepID=UPI0018E581DA|nr:programmed cell death protein 5 isoform X2 [Zerene cesonia]
MEVEIQIKPRLNKSGCRQWKRQNIQYYLKHLVKMPERDVLNIIKLSKPEKATMVENMICRMAQMGQLSTKISEQELIQLLESVNQQMPKSSSTVKFDRRRAALDSDEDDL